MSCHRVHTPSASERRADIWAYLESKFREGDKVDFFFMIWDCFWPERDRFTSILGATRCYGGLALPSPIENPRFRWLNSHWKTFNEQFCFEKINYWVCSIYERTKVRRKKNISSLSPILVAEAERIKQRNTR